MIKKINENYTLTCISIKKNIHWPVLELKNIHWPVLMIKISIKNIHWPALVLKNIYWPVLMIKKDQ